MGGTGRGAGSMNPQKQMEKLLCAHRFALVREDKHKVYKNSAGKVFVTSKTPSDRRAWANALCDLRRVIELPAKPMVLAISDFDRESAARRIQGDAKPVAGIKGNARTKGTGFIYEDKILSPDDLARRDEQRQLSIEAKQRKEARQEQRRFERRLRRDRRLAEELAAFDLIKPFLDSVQVLVSVLWEDNRDAYFAFAANSWWETVGDPDYIGEVDPIFYEFTDTDYLLPVISLRRSLFKDIDLPVDQKDLVIAARMMLIREEWHATWRDGTGLKWIINDVMKAITKAGRETRLQAATSYVLGRAKGFFISNHVRVVVANCLNSAALQKIDKPFVEITIGDFIDNVASLNAGASVENALAVTDAVFSGSPNNSELGTSGTQTDLPEPANQKEECVMVSN
jgi:hypothetical protein